MLVQDDILLEDLINKIEEMPNPVIYVDTEFTRKNKLYHPVLSLIQIAFENEVFIVDILAIEHLNLKTDNLKKILFSEKILKVFHGCAQDLSAISGYFGKIPSPIFDLQIAYMFCSYENLSRISYEDLVANIVNKKLNKKEMKRANWEKRPLSTKHLKYAAEDVVYMQEIHSHMVSELLKNNTYSWFQSEMTVLVDYEIYIPIQYLKKIKNEQELKILNSVFEWNSVANILLSQEQIDICMQNRSDLKVLIAELTKLNPSQEQIELMKSMIGKHKPKEDNKEKSTIPHEDTVVDLCMILLRKCCEEINISPLLIGQKKYITHIIRKQTSPLTVGWRLQAFGNKLLQFLSGEGSLTINIKCSETGNPTMSIKMLD